MKKRYLFIFTCLVAILVFIFCSILAKNLPSYNPKYVGFLTDFDVETALKHTDLKKIDVLIYVSLHLKDENADLLMSNLQPVLSATQKYEKKYAEIIPSVDNFFHGDFQSIMLANLLDHSDRRKKLIQQLLAYVQKYQFSGINLDFENISLTSKENFVLLIQELTTAFHANHRSVYIDLPPYSKSIDYNKISAAVDYVILMAYDEHWSTSKAGPIASLGWYTRVLKKHLYSAPHKKLIIGLGNYGYDWQEGKVQAQSLTVNETLWLAKQYAAQIILDPVSLNPRFNYQDAYQRKHEVWFLDSGTLWNQVQIALPFRPYGFALWRLGSEDPRIWQLFGKRL